MGIGANRKSKNLSPLLKLTEKLPVATRLFKLSIDGLMEFDQLK